MAHMGSMTLRERLSWRISGLPDETTTSERAIMTRALIYLLGLGGLLALVSLPFVPGSSNQAGTLATAIAAARRRYDGMFTRIGDRLTVVAHPDAG